MARAPDGALIDPFGGKRDLEAGLLRHVSEAFAEDPVRILRVARFAARFGFQVAPETLELMKSMVASGEADHLVPERVWQEFSRGLAEPQPERMFEVLGRSGLAARLLGGVKPVREILARAARAGAAVPVRFAVMAWPHPESEVAALCDRLKVPNEVRDLALLACRHRMALRGAAVASPRALLELLKRTDAFRRPERFEQLLEVARLAALDVDGQRPKRALAAAAAIDAGAIAAQAGSPADIPRLVDEARERAIAQAV
jgi:tRNA nucleotidyltransferase (CCA-adding enzyme)